jgi:hypothetical protein
MYGGRFLGREQGSLFPSTLNNSKLKYESQWRFYDEFYDIN